MLKRLKIKGISGIEHTIDGVIFIDNRPHFMIKASDNVVASVIRALGVHIDTGKPIALLVDTAIDKKMILSTFPDLPIRVMMVDEVRLHKPEELSDSEKNN